MAIDDKTIRRYLLGQAGDLEQQSVEEGLLSDEQVRLQIELVEDELIEQYLAGELSSDERSVFESHFLAPGTRRQDMRLTEALQRYAKEHPQPVAAARSSWASLRAKFAFALMAAAMIVAIWIGVSRRNSSVVPGPQQAATPERVAPPQMAALTLAPGLLRSGGQQPVLKVRPAGPSLELHLILPQEASGFAGYRATLATVEGEQVWQKADLQREGDVVNLQVPTSRLKRGDWRVVLTGIPKQGTPSEVSSYYFQIRFE